MGTAVEAAATAAAALPVAAAAAAAATPAALVLLTEVASSVAAGPADSAISQQGKRTSVKTELRKYSRGWKKGRRGRGR